MIPKTITALQSINIIYCIVAAIFVGLVSFEVDLWTSIIEDTLLGEEKQRREDIELSTIIFIGLSAILSIAFFLFYKTNINNLERYYNLYIILFIISSAVLTTLLALQFYYCDKDAGDNDIYAFTRWWLIPAAALSILITFSLVRNRRLL